MDVLKQATTVPRAVITAGGLGTRMRLVTGDRIPKVLVPIAGEPIVFRQLRLLLRYGVSEVVFLAGHLADALREAVAPEAERLGMRVHVLVESSPMGTCGNLTAARELLASGPFFFLCGDIALEMDLQRLFAAHVEHNAVATMVVHPNDHPQDSDLVAVDEDSYVTAVMPRGTRPPGYYRNIVIASVYCLSPRLLDFIEPATRQDLNNDVIPRLIAAGEKVLAYNTPEYIRDVGTPKRVAEVEHEIADGVLDAMHFSRLRPAVFFDRDGVLNNELGGRGITHIDELELLPNAAQAVRTVNDAGHLAVLITNQSQVAKGFVTPKYLERIFAKLETMLGEHGAKLDRIYHCPHHPEQGFPGEVPELKIACECRKPKPGMILRAAIEMPIDLPNSCFIGDTQRDVVAAQRAGVTAYGVRTGRGCRDCTGGIQPVLMFNDALEAARFAVYGVPEAAFLAQELDSKLSARERRLLTVTVCGPQAAGKTLLAHSLARLLRRKGLTVNHVCGDDWRRFHGCEGCSIAEADTYQFIIESFAAGEPTAQTADGRPLEIAPHVNIIEGLYACPPGLRSRIDFAVYVDAHTFVIEDRLATIYRWMGKRIDYIDDAIHRVLTEEWRAVRQQIDFVDATVRLSPLSPF